MNTESDEQRIRYTMNHHLLTIWICRILAVWAVCTATSCRQGDLKSRLDDDVYRTVDRTWRDDFDAKANYRIGDVSPSPGDIPKDTRLPDRLGTLTVAQAVALATSCNRDYQTQREELYIKALDLRLTRHQFEQRYFGMAGAGYTADHNDSAIGAEASVGFNRLLADGTQFSVDLAMAWADVLSGNLRGGLTSILDVAVTKPLLRGSSPDVVMEGLTQAERDVLYQVRTFNHFRKGLVVSVISDYYATLVLLDNLKNAQAMREALVSLLNLAIPLADAGRIPKYEVDRIRQEILTAEKTIGEAQRDYDQNLDLFKLKLGIQTTIALDLDTKELDALKASPLPCPDLSDAEIVATAMARRLDLADEADRVIDARRKIKVAQDRLRADLNLTASANAASSTRGNRPTLTNSTQFDAGLEVDMALDRVAEENAYRLAQIALTQQERRYSLTADTVTAQVRQAHRRLIEAAQRYEICKKGEDLARKRVQDTLLLLRHGKANTRRVLDGETDMVKAQDQRMKALADYAVATLEFYRDTGVLHVRPDGMWEL